MAKKHATLTEILEHQAESLTRVERMKRTQNPMLNRELDRLRILTLRAVEALTAEAQRDQRRREKDEAGAP